MCEAPASVDERLCATTVSGWGSWLPYVAQRVAASDQLGLNHAD